MKEIYAAPTFELLTIQHGDIITTSPAQGDNTLDDGFFDE